MPLLSLHLCRLNIFTSVKSFLSELRDESEISVIFASRPRNTILAPTSTDKQDLLQRYELVLLLQSPNGGIPSNLRSHVWYEYKVICGVPGALVQDYQESNMKLTQETANAKLSGSLERNKDKLDPELLKFMESLSKSYGDKPVTMLNLLRFEDGKKAQYKQYGEAYVPIAASRGGKAKIVGNVVHGPSNGAAGVDKEPTGSTEGQWWDEMSLVHYPSIKAFCDMLVDDDYQAINRKFRQGALKDTMLVCTTEIALKPTSSKL